MTFMAFLRTEQRKAAWAGCFLLLLFVLAGCSGAGHAGHSGETAGAHSDNIEITASGDVLPSFLDKYTQTTRDLYLLAYQYADILKELNCYCGCMEINGHDSLLRCYLAGVDEKGVHWSDHAASCGICLMEVRDAAKLAQEGKSLDDIRTHIDATYGGAA